MYNNTDNSDNDIINSLIDAGLIKYGSFTLKSGTKSNVYFDFKGLNNYPQLVRSISDKLCKVIGSLNVDNYCIAGVPLGAISYATHVAHILNKPMILIREEQKNYGLCNQIEGYIPGKDVVLIEDVITSGQSVIKSLNILKDNNIVVKHVICILDREAGGVSSVKELGYDVICLYKINDVLDKYKGHAFTNV